jgi:hypothetical protein
MKKNLVLFAIAFALCLAQGLRAQNLKSTDVPRILSYQGHITNADQSVTGRHPITVRLYSDPEGKHKLWEDTYTTDVKDGIFSILLGSQNALPTTERLNRPVWLGVSISGTDELRPLTQFTTAPYALNVPDNSITKEKLSEDLQTLMTKPIGGQDKQSGGDWIVGGNTMITNGDTLGSKNGADWIVVTHGERVFRFKKESGAQHPDIIGGWGGGNGYDTASTNFPGNTITSGQWGSNVIAGGGIYSDWHIDASPNKIFNSNWAAIGGGARNFVGDSTEVAEYHGQVIAGGGKNKAKRTYSAVGGGRYNYALGQYSTVSGGYKNVTVDEDNSYSAIPGGSWLKVGRNSFGYSGSTRDNSYTDVSAQTQIAVFNDVNMLIANTDGTARQIRFYETNTDTANFGTADYTSFRADTQTANINYSLPPSIGFAGSILTTDAQSGTNADLKWLQPGSDSLYLRMIGGKPKWEVGSAGGGGVNLKWYKETSIDPVNLPQATSVGAVAHGENVLAAGEYSSIGGGEDNTVTADHAVIGGGKGNLDSATYAGILAGERNTIFPDAEHSVIGGGENNVIRSTGETAPTHSFIGAGEDNYLIANHAVIGGGLKDTITYEGARSFIGAGRGNRIHSADAVIGGGELNFIDTNSRASVVAGGSENAIWETPYGAIAGGHCNWIFETGLPDSLVKYNFIGGGYSNRVWGSTSGAIAGGYWNKIDSGADYSFIGGGYWNKAISPVTTIGGGYWNRIDTISTFSTIGGGYRNKINSSAFATIAGGCKDTILQSGIHSAIGGGCSNAIADSFATIAGGSYNLIFGERGTIGGGSGNLIDAIDHYAHASDNEARFGTIGGGTNNSITKLPLYLSGVGSLPGHYDMPFGATIGGGVEDTASGHFSTASGGKINKALGVGSAIPGGIGLIANDFQAVVGKFNQQVGALNHLGSHDTLDAQVTDTAALFVVGRGFRDDLRLNAFEVTQKGFSTVLGVNGNSTAVPFGNPGRTNLTDQRPLMGATYRDNIIYAWGDIEEADTTLVNPGGISVKSEFGVFAAERLRTGTYKIWLHPVEPHSNFDIPYTIEQASITVTPVDDVTGDGQVSSQFLFATTSPIKEDTDNNRPYFIVRTFRTCSPTGPSCQPYNARFMFKVTGR